MHFFSPLKGHFSTHEFCRRPIVSSLSPRLRKELEDFANNQGGQVELTDAYLRELTHLHNMGMVQFVPGCAGFDATPRSPQPVKEILDYLQITPLGREYLALAQAVTGESKTQ
jgi:hypothetical protein